MTNHPNRRQPYDYFGKAMHDAALHFYSHRADYRLSDEVAYDIRQVADGHVNFSGCDVAAANRGVATMRELYKRLGKLCPF